LAHTLLINQGTDSLSKNLFWHDLLRNFLSCKNLF
jgi:hypothetical protein